MYVIKVVQLRRLTNNFLNFLHSMAGGSGCILGLLMILTRLVASTVLDLVIGSRQSLMKLAEN